MKILASTNLNLGPLEALLTPLADAEDAVSRLDEAMRTPLAEGLRARLEFHEACAWAWNRGEMVHLEDLVLHDDSLDIRMPDQELIRAHAMMRMSRRAAKMKPSELLSPGAVIGLFDHGRAGRATALQMPMASLGRRAASKASTSECDDDENSALRGDGLTPIDALLARAEAVTSEDDAEALAAWFDLERDVPARWPALLRAAVLLEAWAMINPLPRHSYMGAVLVNAVLGRDRRLRRNRLNVEPGRRALTAGGHRRPERQSGLRRTAWWLRAISSAEVSAYAELDRLRIAHQVVARHLVGRRTSSRLGDVIDLFAQKPIVTAPLISQHLGISQQAARGLVRSLGVGVREVTGRSRFQAWRL